MYVTVYKKILKKTNDSPPKGKVVPLMIKKKKNCSTLIAPHMAIRDKWMINICIKYSIYCPTLCGMLALFKLYLVFTISILFFELFLFCKLNVM